MHIPKILGVISTLFLSRSSAIPIFKHCLDNHRSETKPDNVTYLQTETALWVSDTNLCGTTSREHSGYINVGPLDEHNRLNMAFWLFEATEDKDDLPLYIVLGGEAGVPVMQSIFGPTGPCHATSNNHIKKASFDQGRHSFQDLVHTLYIEPFFGIGFSYAEGKGSIDETEEEYLYIFLQRFYEVFPEYEKRRVIIEAFDLGAKVATKFTKIIAQHNKAIEKNREKGQNVPVDSLILISPYLDPVEQIPDIRKIAWHNADGKPWLTRGKAETFEKEVAQWKADCFGPGYDPSAPGAKCSEKERMERFEKIWHGITEGYDTKEARYPDIDPFDFNLVRQDRFSDFLYHRHRNEGVEAWFKDASNQRKIGFASFANEGREYTAFNKIFIEDMLNNTFWDNARDGLNDAVENDVQVVVISGDSDGVINWIGALKIAYGIPDGDFLLAPCRPFRGMHGAANTRNQVKIQAGKHVKYIEIGDAGHDIQEQEPALYRDLVKYIAFPLEDDNQKKESMLRKRAKSSDNAVSDTSVVPEDVPHAEFWEQALEVADLEDLLETPLDIYTSGDHPNPIRIEPGSGAHLSDFLPSTNGEGAGEVQSPTVPGVSNLSDGSFLDSEWSVVDPQEESVGPKSQSSTDSGLQTSADSDSQPPVDSDFDTSISSEESWMPLDGWGRPPGRNSNSLPSIYDEDDPAYAGVPTPNSVGNDSSEEVVNGVANTAGTGAGAVATGAKGLGAKGAAAIGNTAGAGAGAAAAGIGAGVGKFATGLGDAASSLGNLIPVGSPGDDDEDDEDNTDEDRDQDPVEGDEDGDGDNDKKDEKLRKKLNKETEANEKKLKKESKAKEEAVRIKAHKENDDAKADYDEARDKHKITKNAYEQAKAKSEQAYNDILNASKASKKAWEKTQKVDKQAEKDAKIVMNKVIKEVKEAEEAQREAERVSQEAMDEAEAARLELEAASINENNTKVMAQDFTRKALQAEKAMYANQRKVDKAYKISEEKDDYDDAITKGRIPIEEAIAAEENRVKQAEENLKQEAENIPKRLRRGNEANIEPIESSKRASVVPIWEPGIAGV